VEAQERFPLVGANSECKHVRKSLFDDGQLLPLVLGGAPDATLIVK
jgi:hypothetical protein